MLVFIIPVKSKKVSGSWEQFSKLFERTLKSVTNQTSQNFKTIVVCHEKPTTTFDHPNLEYVQVNFHPPVLDPNDNKKNNGLKEEDKSKKILYGVKYSKKYSPDYIMVVDADDCISNRIVQYVDEHQNDEINGWFFKKGYIYREGDKFISLNKENFNTLCGTCIIVRPGHIDAIFQNVPHLLYVHKTTYLGNNAHLDTFPYPGAVYSMANGENHFMSNEKIRSLNSGHLLSLSTIKGIFRKLRKYRIRSLNRSIKEEFGLITLD